MKWFCFAWAVFYRLLHKLIMTCVRRFPSLSLSHGERDGSAYTDFIRFHKNASRKNAVAVNTIVEPDTILK